MGRTRQGARIIARQELGCSIKLPDNDPSDLDIDLQGAENLTELAHQFVDEGLLGDIPEKLKHYLDYDAIARDLGYDCRHEPGLLRGLITSVGKMPDKLSLKGFGITFIIQIVSWENAFIMSKPDLVKLFFSHAYPTGLFAWLIMAGFYMLVRTMDTAGMSLELMDRTGQTQMVKFYGADMTYLQGSLVFPISVAIAVFLVFRYIKEDERFIGRALRENKDISFSLYFFVVIGILMNFVVHIYLSLGFFKNIFRYPVYFFPEEGQQIPPGYHTLSTDDIRIIVFLLLFFFMSFLTTFILIKAYRLRIEMHPQLQQE